MRLAAPITGIIALAILLLAPDARASLAPGDVLIASPDGQVLHLDPASGVVTTWASGGLLCSPEDVVIAPTRRVFVLDGCASAIVEIHPLTGAQTALPTSGPSLGYSFGLGLEAAGTLLVAGGAAGNEILRFDPATGAGSVVATAPSGTFLLDVVADAGGDVLVSGQGQGGGGVLLRVDPTTGAQTTLASGALVAHLAIEPDGNLVAPASSDVTRTTPVSGATTTIASGLPVQPWGIAVEEGGGLLVGIGGANEVRRIDPATGASVLVASLVAYPSGLAVVPPAPPLRGGSVLAADDVHDAILAIDPATGVQSLVVADVDGLAAIALEGSDLLAAAASDILRVDPTSAAATVVTSFFSLLPSDLDLHPDGELVVTGSVRTGHPFDPFTPIDHGSVYFVDPQTGSQQLVTGEVTGPDAFGPGAGVAVEPNGSILVSHLERIDLIFGWDTLEPGITRIVPTTGQVDTVAEGPPFVTLGGITYYDADPALDSYVLVADQHAATGPFDPDVFSVEWFFGTVGNPIPESSDCGPRDVAMAADGGAYVAGACGRLLYVDPNLTGYATVSADAMLASPRRLAVVPPECGDGRDNDGDGQADYPDDPGCASADDLRETDPGLACDDGLDNDGDGRADFDPVTWADPGGVGSFAAGSGDPGCRSPGSAREDPQCQNGVDDGDADPALDYDGGASHNGGVALGTPDPQCAGKPWRNAEGRSSACGLGAELTWAVPLLAWVRRGIRRARGGVIAARP